MSEENYPIFALPQIEAHYRQLATIDRFKSELDRTVTILDRLSQKGFLDPNRDYRKLTHLSALSVVETAGREISEDPDAVLRNNNHRDWNAADASQWARRIHQTVADLKESGELYYQKMTRDFSEDPSGRLIQSMDHVFETLEGGTAAKIEDLQHFSRVRHLADGLRSQIISEEALPFLVSRIYNDLASVHTARVDAAPSTRKNKNTIKWDRSFSDIEGAVARFSSSKKWPGTKEAFEKFEERADRFHTILSEKDEKVVRRRHYEHLFDHCDDGLEPGLYHNSRVGDLLELLPERKKHLQASLQEIEETWETATGHPGDFSQASKKARDNVYSVSPGVSNFGIPTDLLLQSTAYDALSKQLKTLVDEYKYEPETTVFRPSIAQSYFRNLVGLRDQVHDRFDKFLRDNSGGNATEGATREELLKAFQANRQSMERTASRKLARDHDHASRTEAKYDTMVESLARALHTKVKSCRDDFEQIHNEQDTVESRVNSYRASADLYSAEGFLKDLYPVVFDSSNSKALQQEKHMDAIAAKQYLDMAWEASRGLEESPPVEELINKLSLAPEQSRPVQLSLETRETATAGPWKSNFNWAEDEDDEEWWKDEISKLAAVNKSQQDDSMASDSRSAGGDGRSRLSAPAAKKDNPWFGSVPASRRLFG
ncbi:hypothetical protein B9479_001309 [Cryptococcus floricola]|uniref:Uncharacterized protein n=1 Tax=Cryptococcus floricola TaxID=2591691 RepID=A0A5D3B716_9TREE|nr:hypothetical protein B9479_001309 [Cryptococcus floricola]